MDLYKKVEEVIQNHILEHQEEVFKAKTLLNKLDVARCNEPTQDYSFDLTSTNDDGQPYAKKSIYWYDYDRNDPKRPNPFMQIPDYTEL